MVRKNSYRLLIWAIVVLLVTNISMAVSFLSYKKQDKEAASQKETQAIEIPTEQQTKFFREQLELAPEQVEQFRQINRNYNRTANLTARKLEELRVAMIEELGKSNPLSDSLKIITTEIGDLHRILKDSTIEYYLKMNAVCNAQQRGKLNRVFMSMVNKNDEKQPPQRGRRNRFGQH